MCPEAIDRHVSDAALLHLGDERGAEADRYRHIGLPQTAPQAKGTEAGAEPWIVHMVRMAMPASPPLTDGRTPDSPPARRPGAAI